VDGQNLFYAARTAFGHRYPNFDPKALAERVCRDQRWQLVQARFYTGYPSADDDSFWNQFWRAKMLQLTRDRVHIFSRPLRYRLQTIRLADGTPHSAVVGQEKGVDVRLLEPIFEHDFAEQSYGFRPGRGCREAVKRVEELLSQGYGWCVELDFKSYFDTIPHEWLLGLIQQRVVDGSVLALMAQSLKAGVLEEMKGWEPTEAGTRQGAVISPLLANLYLNALDHQMVERGWEMVRYADDLVVLCRTREEAERAMAYLQHWATEAGLTVHSTKTRIVQVQNEGFDFLGWHFRGDKKWPRKKSLQKLQEKLRPLTRRTRGWSLGAIVAKANPVLRGWHGYFRESHRTGLSGPDGWLRRRLRAMLRKREKRPGYGLSSVMDKIAESLQGTVSVELESLTDQFTVLSEDHARVDLEVWQRVARAINQRECLRLRHQRFDGATGDYLWEPYHLAAYHGNWYVLARNTAAGHMETFALSRCRSLVKPAGTGASRERQRQGQQGKCELP
jgi:group II intron reverse transcriptase/maturase